MNKPNDKQPLTAMIDAELLHRGREFAVHALKTQGPCPECKAKRRRIHDCEACLSILIGTAMTEAKLGGPEEFEKKQRQLFEKSESKPEN